MDLQQVGVGTLIGVIVTGAFNLAGKLLQSRTSLNLKAIDDRGQLTKDLMEQLEKAFEELGELRERVTIVQRRELVFSRIFATISAELRVLNGYLGLHLLEIDADKLDRLQLKMQAESMRESLDRLSNILEGENERLEKELNHVSRQPQS